MVGLYFLSHTNLESGLGFSHQMRERYMFYMPLSQGGGITVLAICAFIGHRKIEKTETLINRLAQTVKSLIVDEGVDTFLFGSRSAFDELSYEIVTELRKTYPHIKRVEVRSSNEHLPQMYLDITLKYYEDSYFPEQARNAGYRSYIKRNQAMIDKCDVLVVYCDMGYTPPTRTRSGTIIAVQYAERKKKRIINLLQ